jgi:amino acid adenylation domain-containing protein
MDKKIFPNLAMFEEAEEYWLNHLSGELSEVKLPVDYPRTQEYEETRMDSMGFPNELCEKMLAISKNNDLSLYIILLTSFKILLFKLIEGKDITVVSPIFTSTNQEYNKYVLFRDLVNPLNSFKEFLMQVKQTVVEGYKNEHYPVRNIIKNLDIDEDMSLYRVVLILEDIHQPSFTRELIEKKENDITINISKKNGQMEGSVIYNSALFKEDTIQRFFNFYLSCLSQVLGNTGIPIGDVELFTPEEREKVLYGFNQNKCGFSDQKTLHEIFENQVKKNPYRTAVSSILDLEDVYVELESEKINSDLFQELKNCCFKKNPWVFSGKLEIPGQEGEFYLLKTHLHTSVVVNRDVLTFMDCFDGDKTALSVFDQIKNQQIKLLLYTISTEDILEIEFEFKGKYKLSLEGEFSHMIEAIKILARNQLLNLHNYIGIRQKPEEVESISFDDLDLSKVEILPEHILYPQKQTKCQVLFLGDTPGTPTTGLLYMASFLRRKGITTCCQFYDANRDREILKKNINRMLTETQPEIVAVSMKWFLYIARVKEICKLIKEFSRDIKVVVGGNTASYYAKDIIKDKHIDYVIKGDGEVPMLELCTGKKDIPNSLYKKDGDIIENPITYMENQESSKEIYLSNLDEIMFSKTSAMLGTFVVYTHKGCSMNCFYCGGCNIAQKKTFGRPKVHNRDVEEVRRDLMEVKKYASTIMYDFEDTNERLLEYCRRMWEGIDLKSLFLIYVNIYPPSAEIVALATRTFKYVYWDLDMASLSEKHRRYLASLKLTKPQPLDQEIVAFFDECEKYDNTEIRINLINGLPYLTVEDIETGEKVLKHLMINYTTLSNLHWARLHAQPGAPVVENPESYEMHTYAREFEDFLKFSQKNFENHSLHPGVETFDYPYIYFNDEELNSRTSKNYLDMNAWIKEHAEGKKRGIFSEDWSYEKLNTAANRVANQLRSKGVTPNSVVGVMMDSSLEMSAALLGVLKSGGAYFPMDPQWPAQRIDVMLKDANVTLLLTCTGLKEISPIKDLETFKKKESPLRRTLTRTQIQNLDTLPFADRTLYEKHNQNFHKQIVQNSIALQATRGCPFKCAYCHKIWPKTHVVRSAEDLFEEVKMYCDMGIHRFTFIDDIFNLNVKNSRRFYELILKHGLRVEFHFPNGLRGDILTKDYIDLMVEAGTREMALALETGSPRLQKMMDKHLNLDKFHNNVEYICQKHPNVISILFMMHGFPSETEEEARMTLDFLKSIKWVHFPMFSTLKIYPNTDMERIAIENGISKETILSSENLGFHETPDTLPFSKQFTLRCQTDFLENYFLKKERLLHVLPYQMKIMTEEELLKKYSNHLPVDFKTFPQLMKFLGIEQEDLAIKECLNKEDIAVTDLDTKLREQFPERKHHKDALRILLLDLSQVFSSNKKLFFDVYEPPSGLIHLMSHVNEEFGSKVKGKIYKARYDFDSYDELKKILEEFKPDVVGLRTLTFFKEFFHSVSAKIREFGFKGPLVTGGPYATTSYNSVLKDRSIDLVVMGEGEITFSEVLQAIMDNNGKLPEISELKKINGIVFREEKEEANTTHLNEIIEIEKLIDPNLPGEEEDPERLNKPGDLAYTIFTSGTSGNPKAVMVEHQGLVNYTEWRLKSYGYTDTDVTLQPLSYSFDGFGSNFYSSLLSGGRLLFIPDNRKLDFNFIKDVVKEQGVTNVSLVPGMYEALLQYAGEKDLENLKFVVLAAEKSKENLIKKSRAKTPGLKLYNEYGPTEASVASIGKFISDEKTTTIMGTPIHNTSIYILDNDLKPLPINIPGQLCISGPGVARGYMNNQELYEEKFRDNPFIEGEKIYLTGDFARWLSDGTIELLGRMDHQVKIRGFRVEPGEIETQLLELPHITDVLVVDRESKEQEKYLCAYFVAEKTLQPSELKTQLSGILPDYMIPSFLVQLDAFPLTPNGKVDRKALPDPEINLLDNITLPENEIQEKLVGIWSEVLGMDPKRIGIDLNFFDLGGHSLKAINLISKMHKEFNVRVPLGEMFQTPTILGLSNYIKGESQGTDDLYVSIPIAPQKDHYPLSSAQKRIYVLQQMDPQGIFYNVFQTNYLDIQVDKKKLETIFQQLVQRHESLRTSFEMMNQEPVQKIHEKVELKVSYFEVEGKDVPAIEKIVRGYVKPFDLTQAPLLRVGLIDTKENVILMIDMHHIISDGTSHKVLTDEFLALNEEQELPALRLQYKDYAEWQNSGEQKESLQNQEKYWLKKFSDGIPVINLPSDFLRQSTQSFEGNTVSFVLNPEETQVIKGFTKDTDYTLFMVTLSLYYILLYKLTGEEDIVIGTPTAARMHADLQSIIGMFVNTLAVRMKMETNPSFSTFLKEVKENTIQAFENQEYQFEDLVDKVVLTRDVSRNPLFDVMLTLQNQAEYIEAIFINIEEEKYDHKKGAAKFDLTLTTVDLGARIHFHFEYCTRIFKPETIERFIGYFRKIIRQLSETPDLLISEMDVISEWEKEQLLQHFNDTSEVYPDEKTIQQIFEEQVQETPDGTAIILGENKLSYSELNEKANQLAWTLRNMGMENNGIAGLIMERSIEMMVSLLGILKAGGAYLPIDPTLPEERKQYMLKDSQANLMVTQTRIFTENSNGKTENQSKVLFIDDAGDLTGATHNPESINQSEDLAYVMYTSGSTGTPKAVAVPHKGLINHSTAFKRKFYLTPQDNIVLFASISFDASISEIVMTLLNGSSLCLLTEKIISDFDLFQHYFTNQNITVATLPPSYVTHFKPEDFKSLRVLISAGSPPTTRMIHQWKEKVQFINAYGLTETSVCATHVNISEEGFDGHPTNVGGPIINARVYVLGPNLKLQPIGVMGELCVAGDIIARGYVNQPELTEERFVSNPFEENKKLYKTGDYARWLPNGRIEFLGRMDHQVKVRGYRIELSEIEGQLLKYKDIREVVVIARKEENGEQYLCAYYTCSQQINTSLLREYMNEKLPNYMIPSAFVQMEELPLSPNGKIDREALPKPEIEKQADYIAPRNYLEKKLAEIWSDVLNINQGVISINSNFFELSGHSLKATVLISRIHKELEVKIPLIQIFKLQSIEGIAEYIKGAKEDKYDVIPQADKKDYYQLSAAQKRMYTLQQMEPGGTSYNIPQINYLEEAIEKEKLIRVFQQLIQRHESLRTSFTVIEKEPLQRIHEKVEFSVSYREVSDQEAPEIIKNFVKPFDLGMAPLIRVYFISTPGNKNVLMVDMHHIVADGISMSLLINEFMALLNGQELPSLRLHYKDFAEWENSEVQQKRIRKQEQYWLEEFSEEPHQLVLPTDFQKPSAPSVEGASMLFKMGREKTFQLADLVKSENVTMFMVLLSVYYILLSKLSGQEEIIVGAAVAGRRHADLENVIGMFINMLALKNKAAKDKTYREFLQEVRERTLLAFENQDYQFDDLVTHIRNTYSYRHPIFDVAFSLNQADGNVGEQQEKEMKNQDGDFVYEKKIARYELVLLGTEFKDNLFYAFEFRTSLFKKETIKGLGGYYKEIITMILENMDIKLEDIVLSSGLVDVEANVKKEEYYDFSF